MASVDYSEASKMLSTLFASAEQAFQDKLVGWGVTLLLPKPLLK